MKTSEDCIIDVVLQDPSTESHVFLRHLLDSLLHSYSIPKKHTHVAYLRDLFSRLPPTNYPHHMLFLYIVVQEDTVQSEIANQLLNQPAKSIFFTTSWLPYVKKKIRDFEEFIEDANVIALSKILTHNAREAWITQSVPDLPPT